jgi:hypothetical protein
LIVIILGIGGVSVIGITENSQIFKQVTPVVDQLYTTADFYANNFNQLALLAPNLTKINVTVPEVILDAPSILNDVRDGLGSVALSSGENYDTFHTVVKSFRYGGWAPWLLLALAALILLFFAFTANKCCMCSSLFIAFIAFDLLVMVILFYSTPSILLSTECANNVRTEIITATTTYYNDTANNGGYYYYDQTDIECLNNLTKYYLFCQPLDGSSSSSSSSASPYEATAYSSPSCDPLLDTHTQILYAIEELQRKVNNNPNNPNAPNWKDSIVLLQNTDFLVLNISTCDPFSSTYR